MRILSFLLLIFIVPAASAVPLSDNVLFAFEKCKSLAVDLGKGQLREASAAAFDVRCVRVPEKKGELVCAFFDPGSTKPLSKETFTGGSELGEAEIKDQHGRKIKFLIGKGFASYESGPELKACVGIYIFEQDALKRKDQK